MATPVNKEKDGLIKGEKLAPLSERLAKLGLVKDWDFVLHLPLRYEDLTFIAPIDSLEAGQTVQVEGTVLSQKFFTTSRGMQFTAEIQDATGTMHARFVHFYPSIQYQLAKGKHVRLYGEVRPSYYGDLEMVHPKIKTGKSAESELDASLTPIYPAGEGVQQAWLRKRIARALLDLSLKDPIPSEITESLGLPPLAESIKYLHNPPAGADAAGLQMRSCPQWQRLIFDELLAQQITLRATRESASQSPATALPTENSPLIDRFRAGLPFALTRAQARVVAEIDRDLSRPVPAHRLVQGDVGCGKTVVAALAILRAVSQGHQASLMAPTEILAEQHYGKIRAWLEPLGLTVVWLTGRLKPAEKRDALAKIASGEANVIVGTHALIQTGVVFKDLVLSIVDEQHRFGVLQRLALRVPGPNGLIPHLLMLSATPIPRTLAMSYLADLEVSVIDELPPGRTPVMTKLARLSRKDEVLNVLRHEVEQGRQVYWVCPLIEESEALDLTPATACFEELKQKLPELTVGLVHGAMSAAEKDATMSDFQQGIVQVLVATTVIEVGVDVPNASLMVIEHAERFGLAQLHQLRGRVGRGAAKSACILLYDPALSEVGKERLKIIYESSDGFEIARRDLELRGPGEFLGERQSGMPFLRFADLDRDETLLTAARDVADKWLTLDREAANAFARRWFDSPEDFLSA